MKNPYGSETLVDKSGQPTQGRTRADIMNLKKQYGLRLATIYQTMGPHWKHIYWIRSTPYVATKKLGDKP